MWKTSFVFFINCILVSIHAQGLIGGDDNGLSFQLQIPKISRNSRCPPAQYVSSELFPLPCTAHDDCTIMGSNYFCCPFEGTSMLCAKGLKKERNNNIPKKTTTTTTPTITTTPTTTTLLPTTIKETLLSNSKPKSSSTLVCPAQNDIPYRFFRLPCLSHKDCTLMGKEYICCKTTDEDSHCIRGIKKQKNKENNKDIMLSPQTQSVSSNNAEKREVMSLRKDGDKKSSKSVVAPVAPKQLNEKKTVKSECPSNHESTEIFPLPCEDNVDCRLMGKGYICCPNIQNRKYCIKQNKTTKLVSTNHHTVENNPKTEPALLALSSSTLESLTKTTPTTATTATTTQPAATLATFPTLPEESYKKSPLVTKPTEKSKKTCPKGVRFSFLAVRCNKDHECRNLGSDYLCCQEICVQGVDRPKRNHDSEKHTPLLGLLPRECPSKAFGELFFPLKQCETDLECWPRLCCPEGKRKYCKTPMPRLDMLALTQNLQEPFHNVAGYLQCSKSTTQTKSRECNNSLDCFPNLCCQEGNKKFCRSPDKSLIGLLASSAALASADRTRSAIPSRNAIRN